MSDKSSNKKTSQSKAPNNPKASTPSSGGASAPGIVFDYCPTEFSETGTSEPKAPATEAPEAKPAQPVRIETAPAAEAPAPRPAIAEAPSPKQDHAAPATPAIAPTPGLTSKPSPTPSPSPSPAPAQAPRQDVNPQFVATTTAELSLRMIEIAQANFNASFEFARHVAGAKDLAEVLELQTSYFQQQFAAMTAQTEEMAEFARKFSSLRLLGDLQSPWAKAS